jgi:hypothetical protein
VQDMSRGTATFALVSPADKHSSAVAPMLRTAGFSHVTSCDGAASGRALQRHKRDALFILDCSIAPS